MPGKPNILSITTVCYEEMLKDNATSLYYNWNPPCLGGPDERELTEGHITTSDSHKSEGIYDPIEELFFAVCRQAVNDYIHYYKLNEKKANPYYLFEMKRIENDFFRQYEETELVFEELLRRLKEPGRVRYLNIFNKHKGRKRKNDI